MDTISISNFLYGQSQNYSIPQLVVNLILSAALSWLLGKIYVHYGMSLSNRRRMARIFVPLALGTTLIIMIVKSSVALSLGLVGALSIVRFRSAIKEPEELVYLFIAIAVGLGLGANETVMTLLGFFAIVFMLILFARRKKRDADEAMVLSVSSSSRIAVEALVKILEKHCPKVHLKRFDESAGGSEALFALEVDAFDAMSACKNDILAAYPQAHVSFFDHATTL